MKIVSNAPQGAKTKQKMKKYRKSDRVMEAGDHFKNGASSKSQMRKILTFLALLLVARLGCLAQIISTTDVSFLRSLKGQETINVVFNYDDLMIHGILEKYFLKMQPQKWVTEWEEAKTSLYSERFIGFLNINVNKKKMRVLCGEYPESQYQATVRVLTVGKKWGIECEVIFTKINDTVPLCKVYIVANSRTVSGIRVGGNTYLTGTAFGYAGQSLGILMARKIK